jgi:hypothetical protein
MSLLLVLLTLLALVKLTIPALHTVNGVTFNHNDAGDGFDDDRPTGNQYYSLLPSL